MDAQLAVPVPRNEPVRDYRPGSPERASLEGRIMIGPSNGAIRFAWIATLADSPARISTRAGSADGSYATRVVNSKVRERSTERPPSSACAVTVTRCFRSSEFTPERKTPATVV